MHTGARDGVAGESLLRLGSLNFNLTISKIRHLLEKKIVFFFFGAQLS